jgi:hypothetical protein
MGLLVLEDKPIANLLHTQGNTIQKTVPKFPPQLFEPVIAVLEQSKTGRALHRVLL